MIDSHTDVSQTLMHAISSRINSNDFLKVAEHVADQGKPRFLNDYADTEKKLYPCHTKEATLVNFAYFVDQADSIDSASRERISDKFQQKLAFWELEDTAEELISGVRKTAEVKHAVEVGNVKLFPYSDAKSIKTAAEGFYAAKHKLPFTARNEAAKNLYKAAQEHKVELSNELVRYFEKAACWAMADLDGLVSIVRNRAHDKGADAESLDKIAQTLKVFEDSKNLYDNEKIASFIGAVESYDRLTRRTDKYVFEGLPEERIFNAERTKEASEQLSSTVLLTNGKEVSLNSDFLNKIAAADPELAESIGGDIDKARDILPTLPRPDADYITEVCS